MIFDMEGETPIYRLVRVNGRVTFRNKNATTISNSTRRLLNGTDETLTAGAFSVPHPNVTFKAKHIFVRAGELLIGTKEHPYLGNLTIELHGEKDAKHIVYDNAIEAGNKLIANLNVMKIYGK
jgi:hypothetical protein